jgi:hypothetical protein
VEQIEDRVPDGVPDSGVDFDDVDVGVDVGCGPDHVEGEIVLTFELVDSDDEGDVSAFAGNSPIRLD